MLTLRNAAENASTAPITDAQIVGILRGDDGYQATSAIHPGATLRTHQPLLP